MFFGEMFLLALCVIFALLVEMQLQSNQKKLNYLIGKEPVPYAYRKCR